MSLPQPWNWPNRFWEKVRKGEGCWEWTGSKDRNGYGRIKSYGIPELAHRISWRLTFGEITNEICVLHHCDNPSCCRPDHLFVGTHKDNSADMWAKGRGNPLRGEQHPRAKLTEDLVRIIRDSPLGYRQLGRMYGVHHKNISQIKNRLNWKHVE